MSLSILPDSIIGVIGTVVAVASVGAIFYANIKNRSANQTTQNFKDAIDANEASIGAMRLKYQTDSEAQRIKSQECIDAHTQSLKAIHTLEGEVSVLKTLPLMGINDQLASQTVILKQMATQLKDSAVILAKSADGGGLLVHTTEPVEVTPADGASFPTKPAKQ